MRRTRSASARARMRAHTHAHAGSTAARGCPPDAPWSCPGVGTSRRCPGSPSSLLAPHVPHLAPLPSLLPALFHRYLSLGRSLLPPSLSPSLSLSLSLIGARWTLTAASISRCFREREEGGEMVREGECKRERAQERGEGRKQESQRPAAQPEASRWLLRPRQSLAQSLPRTRARARAPVHRPARAFVPAAPARAR